MEHGKSIGFFKAFDSTANSFTATKQISRCWRRWVSLLIML